MGNKVCSVSDTYFVSEVLSTLFEEGMSSFACEKCGAIISDTERGYVTSCKHYPLEKHNHKEGDMKVTEFAKEITKMEGLKKEVNIAQIAEILKCANQLLGGKLYKAIREE